MRIRRTLATLAALTILPVAAACGADVDSGSTDSAASSESSSQVAQPSGDRRGQGGGPGSVDLSSVTTEEELVSVVQSAYGEASLGLHRGHQPVESTLVEVLGISHDEMHVRMEEQGQNLAAVAEDVGVDPQDLIDALVESWSPAIDNALEAGAITEDEAAAYLDALEDAFTFRVTWDGSEETPTSSAIDA